MITFTFFHRTTPRAPVSRDPSLAISDSVKCSICSVPGRATITGSGNLPVEIALAAGQPHGLAE